ncbi:MAG: Ribosome-associated ATPase [Nitrospirae bacterium]|nr:MAG: ABC transporter permease [Nitrospira sp. OLB3]MBV6468224.1 Ribosome-associated ATPase [Nitrospirota bacterium]MCE7966859.1 ABC transporter permease [Nitrospira sp. NTP2]MCK6493759.1 ABC transporter permease [Nitrospira sp.]MEB2337454.1 ABC transporter permease [Nitrospirales bacterium]
MALKEWKETTRDRLFLLLAFLLPALWLVVFGYGLNLDVEDIPFAVVDRDHSELSRDYLQRFIQSRYFSFQGYADEERALDRLLTGSKIRAAIIVPERFQEQLVAGDSVAVQTLLDGTFPLHTDIAKGYVIAINQSFTEDRLIEHLRRSRGLTREQAGALVRPLSVEVRYLYNEEVRSTWSMVPALVMFTLMLASPLLTALGVVREKETGSIYNIYSSTVSRAEFLTGKLLPYIVISLVNVCMLWLMAVGLFQVPFKGQFLLFFSASVLFVFCTTGIGLLISLLVQTQMAALIITMVVAMIPTILFSGLLVPVASLTQGAKVQAHLYPAMYYTNIVRGSFLKGVSVDVLWIDLLALAIFAAAISGITYRLFTKRPKA